MTDMEKGRPQHSGDPSANSSNVLPQGTSVTGSQSTEPVVNDMARLAELWDNYEGIMSAAVSADGVCHPSPGKDYVATFVDGDSEPVAGFDRAGHPLIRDARYGLIRADAIPTYVGHGWDRRLGWSA